MPRATPTVFVVDGDASLRASLEPLIERQGWRSELFACARDFLAFPSISAPSCLVLDVGLPDLDGLELQRRLTAERANLPIVFVTRHGDVSTAVRAMKAGAIEFLTRPFDGDE